MATYVCHCKRFAIRPSPVEADTPSDAALKWAQRHLPNYSCWGDNFVEYAIVVQGPDPSKHEQVEHVYAIQHIATHWGKGKYEDG